MSVLLLLTGGLSFAHDEGHGPKLSDQPKFGGKVVAVIDKKEINKGTKAEMLYKAELTKNHKNVINIYLYQKSPQSDGKLKPLKLDGFESATAELLYREPKVKGWLTKEFKMTKSTEKVGKSEITVYQGTLPLKPRRRFSVDVTLEQGSRNLFMAFDGLH